MPHDGPKGAFSEQKRVFILVKLVRVKARRGWVNDGNVLLPNLDITAKFSFYLQLCKPVCEN